MFSRQCRSRAGRLERRRSTPESFATFALIPPAGGEGDDHSRNIEDSDALELENLKGGMFGADQPPERVPRGLCSASNFRAQPAFMGTPHVFLALEGQRDGGTAAIAWELFEVQPDKPGSALAYFSGQLSCPGKGAT